MRLIPIVLLTVIVPLVAHGSPPTIDAIDYSNPTAYLAILPTLGNREQIVEQGLALKGRSDRATVRHVLEWMDENLKYDPSAAYEWRDYEEVIRDGCYGGCADQGVVCGALLKAAGIPVVWVKTMDVPWIWNFKKGRPFESWSGHVFLEIYIDGQWVLLDPGAKLIYPDYSPKTRLLPGNRFAYHKGDDPKQMIMSTQWEPWKEQTREYFAQLDPTLLPIDVESVSTLVPHVYIVGNDPFYKALADMARSRGWTVRHSFNSDYDRHLPSARGHVLLIETHGGEPIIPLETLQRFFPDAATGLKSADGAIEIDGTTIMFVDFNKTLDALDEDGAPKVHE